MSKERNDKKSIIYLKVSELKELIEKALNSKNKISFEKGIQETLKKLDDSIIELNEDDLRNLILNAASCCSLLNQSEQGSDEKFQLITRHEMAEVLDISLPTLRKWTQKRIIPNHIKLGGFIYYNKQQVIDFLKAKR